MPKGPLAKAIGGLVTREHGVLDAVPPNGDHHGPASDGRMCSVLRTSYRFPFLVYRHRLITSPFYCVPVCLVSRIRVLVFGVRRCPGFLISPLLVPAAKSLQASEDRVYWRANYPRIHSTLMCCYRISIVYPHCERFSFSFSFSLARGVSFLGNRFVDKR